MSLSSTRRHGTGGPRRMASIEAALAAAEAVFDEQGLQRAHMAEIAQRAGMAKAHLYNLFRNKDQLYLAVYRRAVLQALPVRLRALRRVRDRAERLRLIGRSVATLAQRRTVHRLPLDLCERALHDAELRAELDEIQAEIDELVRCGLVAAGLLTGRSPDAERSIVRLLSCLPSLLPLAASTQDRGSAQETLTRLLEGLFAASHAG